MGAMCLNVILGMDYSIPPQTTLHNPPLSETAGFVSGRVSAKVYLGTFSVDVA